MAVENPKTVDAMGMIAEEKIVQLLIDDEQTWEDESAHLRMLEEKINGYLSFWRSGQILEKYPEADDYKVVIKIRFKYKLSEYAKKVVEDLEKTFEKLGIGFVCEVLQII